MCTAYTTHGAKRNAFRILLRRTEGKRQLRITSCWWEYSEIVLGEIGRSGMFCIYLVQDRNQWCSVMNTVIKFWVL
jgi:hypothetical protein